MLKPELKSDWLPSALAHLQRNFLGLAIVTAAGVVAWAADHEVTGVLVTVLGGLGLFGSILGASMAEHSD
jgi:hypothetical protein